MDIFAKVSISTEKKHPINLMFPQKISIRSQTVLRFASLPKSAIKIKDFNMNANIAHSNL